MVDFDPAADTALAGGIAAVAFAEEHTPDRRHPQADVEARIAAVAFAEEHTLDRRLPKVDVEAGIVAPAGDCLDWDSAAAADFVAPVFLAASADSWDLGDLFYRGSYFTPLCYRDCSCSLEFKLGHLSFFAFLDLHLLDSLPTAFLSGHVHHTRREVQRTEE